LTPVWVARARIGACDTADVPDQDRSLALAADIERRDGDVEAALEVVALLSRRAEDVRRRSEELQDFLESVPGELARLDLTEMEARESDATAAAALAQAEQHASELAARQPGSEKVAAAAQERETARRLAGDAAARYRRVVAERSALLEAEASSRREIGELVQRAGNVATRLDDVPRVSRSGREVPGETLAELAEWGRRVQAALFVVRGQLEAERDRLIREVNELAGVVLGEELAGSSVALVRKRLEEALRR